MDSDTRELVSRITHNMADALNGQYETLKILRERQEAAFDMMREVLNRIDRLEEQHGIIINKGSGDER